MKLSARARRLFDVLQHGPTCSQAMMSMRDELNTPLFGSWPPNAATELKKWLFENPSHGRFEKERGCSEHKTCESYRLVHNSAWLARPVGVDLPAIPVDPRER